MTDTENVTSVCPEEAEKVSWNMSVCGKKPSMGVNHRIMDLADRKMGL